MRNFGATCSIVLLIAGFFAAAAAAGDEPPRGECHRLTRQIARYQGDLARAESRGNELWEEATKAQLRRLHHRLRARCPEHVPAPTLGERFGEALDLAGRGALKVLPFLQ